jgi:hypothetical protein
MKEHERSDRTRSGRNEKVTKVELDEYCQAYLREHKLFDWILERYYGKEKVLELWNLAQAGESEHIKNIMNGIWFDLPDHIFNIRNNPPGWEQFLHFVED